MAKPGLDRPLEVSTEVAATPKEVWQIVSDLRRTPEWSPECFQVRPLGEVRRGGWLVGLNRRNRVRWATVSRIVRFEPEHEIAWKVLTNRSVWTYRLEQTPSGTRIVERRDTPNGVSAFARGFTKVLLGGQRVHDDELEAGMADGLQRIGAITQARSTQ